jgi:hypothetical protein
LADAPISTTQQLNNSTIQQFNNSTTQQLNKHDRIFKERAADSAEFNSDKRSDAAYHYFFGQFHV